MTDMEFIKSPRKSRAKLPQHGYQAVFAGRGGEGYLYPTGYQVFTHDRFLTVLTNNDNHEILLWDGVDYVMLEEWQLTIIEKYGVLK